LADTRLKIAVFIDFDNIEIGVKSTLNAQFDIGVVLEALKERGDVVSKTAYGDWTRAGDYSRSLTQHATKLIQRNLTPGGDKNGADINLALDALEMAFTHPHINAFVIVGGDSDFISLVEKLKQYDKKVFVVGGKQFTSAIMQRNCHEFIAYENLIGQTGERRPQGGGREHRRESQPIAQAVPLVTRALTVLSEREGAPPLGLLKTTMLQLDSTFDERSFGAGSFRDFTQKLEKLGVVKVQPGRGGWVVQPADAPVAAAPDGASTEQGSTAAPSAPVRGRAPAEGSAPATIGSPADGVQAFVRLLKAAGVRRWPLYLRNVKQILRQASPPLDERAYGFAQITDLVRAAQRDGFLRMERDRQGVVRVFQGPGFDGALAAASPSGLETQHDTAAADLPVSADVDSEFRDATSSVPNEREASAPAGLPADVVREGRDAELPAGDAGLDPGEAPAPLRKRRPNRGTGRRRPIAKK